MSLGVQTSCIQSCPILDKHMPWRKLSRKEMRSQAKPWITQGILNSIKQRESIFRKYIEAKDPIRKEALRTQYKTLRNRITYIINHKYYIHSWFFISRNKNSERKNTKVQKLEAK